MKKASHIIVGILFAYSGCLQAQNVDSIFSIAVNNAKQHHYETAIQNAYSALSLDAKRGDILVFIANVHSWQNKNDSALFILQKARNLNYFHDDFYESCLNVLLRTHQYDELLKACDDAKAHHYSNSEDILHKQLIAFSMLKKYNQAIELTKLPENKKIIDENASMNALITDLYIKRNINILSANYTLDLFDYFAAQHIGSISYSRKMGNNTFLIHSNFASRFGLNDLQLEGDFYWQLTKNQYMYFNYGYGLNATLFSRHRIGYEYYFSLNHGWELSTGGRYMIYPITQVTTITGHIGKYIGKGWLSFRPFYVFQKKIHSLSFIADYRLYGNNQFNYWGTELGFGNSPDDIYSTSQTNGFNQLNAYKIKIEKNFLVNRVSEFHIGLGYTREEFRVGNFRNRYTIELGYKIHFN
jgi:YaiO family outer membrane protein